MNYYENYLEYCDRLRIPEKHRATPAVYEKTVSAIPEHTLGCGYGSINDVESTSDNPLFSLFNEDQIHTFSPPVVLDEEIVEVHIAEEQEVL